MHALQSTPQSPATLRRACLAGPTREWGAATKETELKAQSDRTKILKYVRDRAGEKLFIADVAALLHVSQQLVLKTIKANAQHAGNYHWDSITHKFASTGAMYRVWFGPSAQDNVSDLCKRITRLMIRPPVKQQRGPGSKVFTAAMLAKKLEVSNKAVADELEAMRARGEVVRCELVLRKGYERFEYRLMGVA